MPTNDRRRLAAVLFTDIEGYSALTEKDQDKALSSVTQFREVISRGTEESNGNLIHFYGDGSLSIFPSSVDAVRGAIKMQKQLIEAGIPVRMGIHLGEVIDREDTVFGSAVNIASRVQDLASAGSILVTTPVAEQLSNQEQIRLVHIGEEKVKNIRNPIGIHAVDDTKLVQPSWAEIRKRNKRKRNGPMILAILLLAVIIVMTVIDNPFQSSNPIGESRVIVLPFENHTGDPDLDFIGEIAASHISRCLEETENARVVRYESIAEHGPISQMASLSLNALIRTMQAEKVIRGSYTWSNDTTLAFSSVLQDAKTLEDVRNFPEVYTHRSDYIDAVRQIGDRFAGFWLSGESTLSIPTQDAYKAYVEALRVWVRDYDRAIGLLEKAIRIDSTFIDAHFLLFDAYFNQFLYPNADSVINVIERRFAVESLKPSQLRTYQYYRALIDGDNLTAHRITMEEYEKDPYEIYLNTAAAHSMLQYVNEPARTLEILELIPFDSIDFETWHYFRDRISYAAQASLMLGEAENAREYISYYPPGTQDLRHIGLTLRTYAALDDTTSINKILRDIEATAKPDIREKALYQLCRDARLIGNDRLHEYYSQKLWGAYARPTSIVRHIMYLQDFDKMDSARAIIWPVVLAYPGSPSPMRMQARQYALEGKPDSARQVILRIEDAVPEEYDYGWDDYMQAQLYALIGDNETALFKLRQSLSQGMPFDARSVDNDPDLNTISNMEDYHAVTHPLKN